MRRCLRGLFADARPQAPVQERRTELGSRAAANCDNLIHPPSPRRTRNEVLSRFPGSQSAEESRRLLRGLSSFAFPARNKGASGFVKELSTAYRDGFAPVFDRLPYRGFPRWPVSTFTRRHLRTGRPCGRPAGVSSRVGQPRRRALHHVAGDQKHKLREFHRTSIHVARECRLGQKKRGFQSGAKCGRVRCDWGRDENWSNASAGTCCVTEGSSSCGDVETR
jgi:hypothetical protein